MSFLYSNIYKYTDINFSNITPLSNYNKFCNILKNIFTYDEIQDFALPKIIVIGRELSGKSSLLEKITNYKLFPIDKNICTRCPIHVIFKKNIKTSYKISYYYNNFLIIKTVYDKNKIYDIIFQHMKNLNNTYSTYEITIEIQEKNVPTLELYDLPGIIDQAVNGNNITIEITKKYISMKNSIILCVEPATTVSLKESPSIKLLQELTFDYKCILVLTMLDKIYDNKLKLLLLDRLKNNSTEFNDIRIHMCYGIINNINQHKLKINNDCFDAIKKIIMPHKYIKNYEYEFVKKLLITSHNTSDLYYNNFILKTNIGINNVLTSIYINLNKFIYSNLKSKAISKINSNILSNEIKYINLGSKLGDINFNPEEIFNYIKKLIYEQFNNNLFLNRSISLETVKLTIEHFWFMNDLIKRETIYTSHQVEINTLLYYIFNDKKYNIDRFSNFKNYIVNFLKNLFDNYIDTDDLRMALRNIISFKTIGLQFQVNTEDYYNNIKNCILSVIRKLLLYKFNENFNYTNIKSIEYIWDETPEYIDRRKHLNNNILKSEYILHELEYL